MILVFSIRGRVTLTRSQASDFLYIIPTIQHLRNVRLTMAYCELPENEMQLASWTPRQKWKSDPGANGVRRFAPSNKYYVNGELVSEAKPSVREARASPFRGQRVPRRGLVAVSRDDAADKQPWKEQGVGSVSGDPESPALPNGVHSSPASVSSQPATASVNGVESPALIPTAATDTAGSHQPISPSSESGPAQGRPLVNGIHGVLNTATTD